MNVIIPEAIVQATRMSPEEILREIAVLLFQQDKLSCGQAAELAEMNQREFRHLLASRQIPLHYGVEEFEQDLRTLEELGHE
jgi:predicted HTH domain antitoxin